MRRYLEGRLTLVIDQMLDEVRKCEKSRKTSGVLTITFGSNKGTKLPMGPLLKGLWGLVGARLKWPEEFVGDEEIGLSWEGHCSLRYYSLKPTIAHLLHSVWLGENDERQYRNTMLLCCRPDGLTKQRFYGLMMFSWYSSRFWWGWDTAGFWQLFTPGIPTPLCWVRVTQLSNCLHTQIIAYCPELEGNKGNMNWKEIKGNKDTSWLNIWSTDSLDLILRRIGAAAFPWLPKETTLFAQRNLKKPLMKNHFYILLSQFF